MSRAVIGAVVATLIAVLTATAFFTASSTLEGQIRSEVKRRVAKAQELLVQNARVEILSLLKRTEGLARDPDLIAAMADEKGPQPVEAEAAFQKFRASLSPEEPQPDLMAVTDDAGKLVALVSGDEAVVNPVPDTYLKDGKPKYAPLEVALSHGVATSDVWDYENSGAMKVSVAPIVETEVGSTVGAVIVAYSLTSQEATKQRNLLGAEVAFFYGDKVHATSLGNRKTALKGPLFDENGLAEQALKDGHGDLEIIDIGGHEYVATTGRLPRYESKKLPEGYPRQRAGAAVLISMTEATSKVSPAKTAILLVGGGGIVLALLAMMVTAKRILGPLDQIETGVNDIINGNLNRVFEPVGSDLDGLANALNVMLARLLGRPEPGEEEFDEHGNIIQNAPRIPGMTPEVDPKQAEAMALAQEPEDAYLSRLFEEFVAAQSAAGEAVETSFDAFFERIRSNEAKLKEKYGAREVRFKVVTDGGKVTLKPVPIR